MRNDAHFPAILWKERVKSFGAPLEDQPLFSVAQIIVNIARVRHYVRVVWRNLERARIMIKRIVKVLFVQGQ